MLSNHTCLYGITFCFKCNIVYALVGNKEGLRGTPLWIQISFSLAKKQHELSFNMSLKKDLERRILRILSLASWSLTCIFDKKALSVFHFGLCLWHTNNMVESYGESFFQTIFGISFHHTITLSASNNEIYPLSNSYVQVLNKWTMKFLWYSSMLYVPASDLWKILCASQVREENSTCTCRRNLFPWKQHFAITIRMFHSVSKK